MDSIQKSTQSLAAGAHSLFFPVSLAVLLTFFFLPQACVLRESGRGRLPSGIYRGVVIGGICEADRMRLVCIYV